MNNNKITSELLKSIDKLKKRIKDTQTELIKIEGLINNINQINDSQSHGDTVNVSGQKLAVDWILKSAKLIKQNCNFIQQSNINSQIVDLKNKVNNVKVAYNNAKGLLKLNELDLLVDSLVSTAELLVEILMFYNKFVNRLCTVTP
jgi:hypothetical protein|tara:strand:- start:292 stop:729 length:438 start_codon:yes stop_codon:yes gene_type:complete